MSQELLMKCRTILLKWRCIGGDECWPNWQWKTFQRNIWGGCYKVFQTCNNILGTCWVFAKNDWNTINQMEALDENTILDQEWMYIADLIQKSLGSTWRLAVKTDNKKYNKQRNVKKWNKKKLWDQTNWQTTNMKRKRRRKIQQQKLTNRAPGSTWARPHPCHKTTSQAWRAPGGRNVSSLLNKIGLDISLELTFLRAEKPGNLVAHMWDPAGWRADGGRARGSVWTTAGETGSGQSWSGSPTDLKVKWLGEPDSDRYDQATCPSEVGYGDQASLFVCGLCLFVCLLAYLSGMRSGVWCPAGQADPQFSSTRLTWSALAMQSNAMLHCNVFLCKFHWERWEMKLIDHQGEYKTDSENPNLCSDAESYTDIKDTRQFFKSHPPSIFNS